QVLPGGVAQQAAADGGHADQRRVEVDEGGGGVGGFGAGGGVVPAGALDRLVDVGHRQAQALHRAAVEQGLPRLDRAEGVVHHPRRRGGGAGRGGGGRADATAARHRDGGAGDAVADDHQRDGGAADDVDRRRRAVARRGIDEVQAHIAVDEGLDAGFGDADQHDGFVVFDQAGGFDAAVVGQGHHDVDGLAGIAARVDHVGGQVDMAQGAVAGVGAGGERLAFGRAEAVGAGVEFAGREGGQEMRQPLGLRRAEEDSGTGQEEEGEDAKQPRGIWRYYEPVHAITL